MPTSLSYAISHAIADISYIFYKSAAANVKQNLRLVFPDIPSSEISYLTKKLFRNYGKYLVDYGRFMSLDKNTVIKKIVTFDGKENLNSVLEMGKGLILLTAHLGNWELGGIFFGSCGIKTNVVTIQDKNADIDNTRRLYREKHNVGTITIGNSPFSTFEMVNALTNGETIAMLIDRYNSGDGITADFFGKPVKFPKGPFILSKLTGAPIVVAFVVKEGKGYRGIVSNPMIVRSEKEERETLRAVVKILENYIIMYPDQWYNFTPI